MPQSDTPKLSVKILLITMLGNGIEQFDFILYILLTPVLAPLFFPAEDKILSLILSLSVYAVGFVARPLGALYFGQMGDRKGRKQALSMSIFGMAFAMAAMSFLPTYDQIGIWAPMLLISLRLLQSFCVAGEYNGGAIYILEQTPPHRQNFIGGVYSSSGSLGLVLGSLTLAIVLKYQLVWDFAWRFAFLLPCLFGFTGYYIRKSLPETLSTHKRPSQSCALKTILSQYSHEMFLAFSMASLSGCLIYFLLAFPNIFIPLISNFTLTQMSPVITFVLIIFTINLWFTGYLADRVGSEKFMVLSTITLLIAGPVLYAGFLSQNIVCVTISLSLFTFFVASVVAPAHMMMMKLFPAETRYTTISLAYNLGNGLLGASSSMIAMSLYKTTSNILTPIFYIFFCVALFLLSFILYLNKKNQIFVITKKLKPSTSIDI